MPSSGSCPSPRAIPTDSRFCVTISPATSRIIISSGRPPLRRTRRSHWKPTEVKKAIMKKSRSVPSKWHSTPPNAYRERVSSEMISPPVTGAGMQCRFRKGTLRVRNSPSIRAATPTPAL